MKELRLYITLLLMSMLCLLDVNAQDVVKNGRLLDSEGNAVKGATISIVGKDRSTVTDDNGYFNIGVNDKDVFLIEAGLCKETFKVKEDKDNYILEDYHNDLKWGLGNEKTIENNTAAISTIFSNDISKSSAINPENAIYGLLPGLSVLQNGGAPWARRPDMFIRGISTVNNKAVLVVIDGIERPLSSLVSEDIKSISVLKDAAALAIYGQRGANGAIVVTTKRGEYDSFSIDASYQYGINTPVRLPKMLDAYNYAQAVNEASALDGNSFVYSKWDLADYKNGSNSNYFPNVDWVDECLKDYGISTNFNSQFRGGGKAIRYYSSINYQTEKGLFNNTNLDSRYDSQLKYTRFNVRANIDADVTPGTVLSVNLNASLSDRKYPFAGVNNIIKTMYNTPSTAFPVKTENGKWGGTDIYDKNPVAMIAGTGYRQDFHRELLGDVTLKQDLGKFVKGLSAEISAGFDNSAIFWEGKKKTYEYESFDVTRDAETGEILESVSTVMGRESDLEDYDSDHNDLTQWRRATLRTKLDYSKNWENSRIHASLLYSQDKYVEDKQYHTWLRQNLAGYLHYGIKDKYLAELTMSYAGSSNLSDGDRFDFFPALSLGWILSKESFMDAENVNYLKVRASYGLTGSDLMTQNLYDQQFTNGGKYFFGNNYSGSTGIKPGRLATTGLTSELGVKSNVGVDMLLFDRLSIVLDAFYEKRKDILVDTEGIVSNVIGVTTAKQNDGEVTNKGIDADLQWKANVGSFTYYVGGNFSFSKNKIVNNNEAYRKYDYQKRTGQSVGQMFGLEAIGFFKDAQDIASSPKQSFSEVRPGDIKYKDQNGDKVIDQYDEVAIGNSSLNPEIYYGIKLGFEIKGFGVDAVFQGIANQTIYMNTSSIFVPLRNNTNISEFSASRWVPQNMDGAELPRLSMNASENNYRKNSIWLADGDYLKLRSLNVYYKLPEKLIRKVKMKHAKVFVRGMNLFSIDNIKVMDPEAIGLTYPTLASYHLGVKIGF
ncbi:SusC/RagA family TonB-linked outer membrane protein [Puteibacter caeruleilacunae]|nr:SusC/RagA family TonB-linked outer membrane protein [Puteibacter caeruleilacunae]